MSGSLFCLSSTHLRSPLRMLATNSIRIPHSPKTQSSPDPFFKVSVHHISSESLIPEGFMQYAMQHFIHYCSTANPNLRDKLVSHLFFLFSYVVLLLSTHSPSPPRLLSVDLSLALSLVRSRVCLIIIYRGRGGFTFSV